MQHLPREAITCGGVSSAPATIFLPKTVSTAHDRGTGLPRSDLIFEHSGQRRLNGFFAFWVNSPSMSMVNFSCCVCSTPRLPAPGVTRRVTPQPSVAAVRMEAGDHARL